MLEDFLKDIYDNALVLELLKEVSYYTYIRQSYRCGEIWNEAVNSLSKIINDIKKSDEYLGAKLVSNIMKAKDCFDDHSAFSSIIDNDIIPIVSEYLSNSSGIDVDDGFWTLLSSKTGFLTLKDRNGIYLHSYSDPMWESFLYALNIYDPYVTRYNILGGGLGYLAYQLWRLSDGEAEIYVYEVNDAVANYSYLYGVMSLTDVNHVHMVCDDDKDLVIENYFEDIPDKKIIRTTYYWDKDNYSGPYSGLIESIKITEFTTRVFDAKWKRNYSFNRLLEHSSVSEFELQKHTDEWVIVAAGPSLNDNKEFIIESVGTRTICTVNTSLKWFSLNDVKPDICFACDPDRPLVAHIEGYQEFSCDIPVIADCITNHNYLELYRGPRYYIISNASSSIVDEKFAPEEVWSFGGTVTSMAIEAAFRMGAKKIYLIGADLAYPGRTTYADGVGKSVTKWNADEKMVASVEDALVPTSKVFAEYIWQIEDQISRHPDCEVINRSLHGAYLKGSYCGKWWENILIGRLKDNYTYIFEELKKDSLILGWSEKYYIFWQTVNRMELNNCMPDDQEDSVVESAYKVIYDEFLKDMNPEMPQSVVADKTLTYIFTSEFWNDTDEQTQKVKKLAKSEAQNKKNTLIINTSEKLGGNAVPIHNAVPVKYNNDLEKADKVVFENRSFPYFQLSKGMPNTDHYRLLLESLFHKKP